MIFRLVRTAVLLVLVLSTEAAANIHPFECRDSEYRATLTKLQMDNNERRGSAIFSSLSESISAEIGRYEQLGRQQSHRYALSMGSINGKLAVLDDPKRAESFLKDSIRRAKEAIVRTEKNSIHTGKKV